MHASVSTFVGSTARQLVAAIAVIAATALIATLAIPNAADAQQAEPFACAVDAGELSWSDDGQPRYWVYKSADNGATFGWIGRTLGATTFTDPNPTTGARYQVHYDGIARVNCTITAEPINDAVPFGCASDAGVLTWTDANQIKYWTYKSTDDGLSWVWLGRTLGATTITDPEPAVGTRYQVHYNGIPRIFCTVTAEPPASGVVDLPAIIEAENYATAIDTEPGNQGRATQFSGDADVWGIPGSDGHVVGRIRDGESTTYDVTVSDAGRYQFAISASSGAVGGTVTISVDDQVIGQPTALENTGAWWTFTTTMIGSIDLSTGSHTVTVAWGPGQSNFDKLIVTPTGDTPPACTIDGRVVPSALPQSECTAIGVFAGQLAEAGDPCTWSFVTCNDAGTSITEISIAFASIAALPAEIGDLTNLGKLSLLSNELTSLPPEIGNLTNLTELDLDGNRIAALPSEIGNLTNVTHLNLASNLLTALPASLGNLTNLTTLNLTSNRLPTLPPEIGNLTSLRTLALTRNPLTSLPAEMAGLADLNLLTLSTGAFTELPPAIGELPSLSMLTLVTSGQPLPPGLGNFTNIEALNLRFNDLPQLPAEIGDLTNLTTLNLQGNDLTQLPAEIGNLANLTTLNLERNSLTALPDEIVDLANLTVLNLSSNDLVALPTEIDNLTALSVLNLDGNALTTLPLEISALAALTELRLRYNELSNLPTDIGNLTNLMVLDLRQNEVSDLPASIGDLTELTELDLLGNNLTTLPPEMAGLTSLSDLSLSSNDLTVLPSVIAALGNLTELDLGFNPLPTIATDIGNLAGLDLTALTLSSTGLTALPAAVTDFTALTELDLWGNDLAVLPGDITVLEAGLADGILRIEVGDGFGRNDCLTTTNADLRQALEASSFFGQPWDQCDTP